MALPFYFRLRKFAKPMADFYFNFNFQATKNTSQQFYFSTARVALLSTKFVL